jgi:futalosine hydrolase
MDPADRSEILWIAATKMEAATLPAGANALVTGIGPATAAGTLARHLARGRFRRVVGVGIAGAYPLSGLELGQVVQVVLDGFVDLGAETEVGFKPLWELGIHEVREALSFPASEWSLISDLPRVSGGTCSVCTGTLETAVRRAQTGAQIESMEGAAWAQVAQNADLPFDQIRAISNVAGPRDREAWKIPEAIEQLRITLAQIWSKL